MTEQEKKALAKLKKAFKECDKVGLKFAGMDCTILYSTKEAYEEAKSNRRDSKADYCEVAFAVMQGYEGAGTLLDGFPYVDSGGW